ncbi:Tad domain-containing protein [Sutcliffiella rhizosphaerae]|uniref:Putative Flp pilus-assembly TadG-like N-terminal domain-containing protein n=1 Tax=Sutcliffiella rhizosphaerae TaxID=2880967 RepID=A0ABM8YK88_9BACI|nr:Tad domain-containing protein [Sutcliffiella rhizosphaerae]CAG9620270.1 hypothetical protein BACCIP111883_01038 [Sutcliffiella rhizosphaerae]
MKSLKDQRGNVILLTLGIFAVMSLLFLLVFHFAKVFVVKESASNYSDQASLAAASVLYEKLVEEIENYDRSLPGFIDELIDAENLQDKIEERKQQLRGTSDWLEFELNLKAVNEVLEEELKSNNPFLKDYIELALNNAKAEIPQAVERTIRNNDGHLDGTEIEFTNNYRIEVTTSVRFTALQFDQYIPERNRYVKQSSVSPTFVFLKQMNDSQWRNWKRQY